MGGTSESQMHMFLSLKTGHRVFLYLRQKNGCNWNLENFFYM